MKFHIFFKKYPLLCAIIVTSLLFSLLGYLGKNTIYKEYSIKLWETPMLAAVFEGVGENKFPWTQYAASETFEEVHPGASETASAPVNSVEYPTLPVIPVYADNTLPSKATEDSNRPFTGKAENNHENTVSHIDSSTKKDTAAKDNTTVFTADTEQNIEATPSKNNTPSTESSDDNNNSSEHTKITSDDSVVTVTEDTVDHLGANTDAASEEALTSPSKDAKSESYTSKAEPTITSAPVNNINTDSKPFIEFTNVKEDYFNDALFIGDSRTVGLSEYSGWNHTTYFADVGLTIYDVLQKEIVPEGKKKITIPSALKEKQYKKIYIMLGINELGRGTTETFINEYQKVIDQIEELQPEAIIFVEGIMTVSKEKSDTDPIFNNKNIKDKNNALTALADNSKIFYIDVNDAITDKTGNLPAKYTFDNIHLKAAYYQIWTSFLLSHGIE